MDRSNQILSWTDHAISFWKSKAIQLQNGISVDKIADLEKLLDFKFPKDFIALYSKVNGFEDFEWNEHLFSVWSVDRILKEYHEDGNSNYIGFCDFLINSHSIGFLKSAIGVYKSYDQTQPVAKSFEDLIFLINSNSDLIY